MPVISEISEGSSADLPVLRGRKIGRICNRFGASDCARSGSVLFNSCSGHDVPCIGCSSGVFLLTGAESQEDLEEARCRLVTLVTGDFNRGSLRINVYAHKTITIWWLAMASTVIPQID